jgi:hypothetical protein
VENAASPALFVRIFSAGEIRAEYALQNDAKRSMKRA